MRVTLAFELNNTDFNPISEYKPPIYKLVTNKDVTFGDGPFSNVLAKKYIWAYRNNLRYFIGVDYLSYLGYCDHQNFEKRLRGVFTRLFDEIYPKIRNATNLI